MSTDWQKIALTLGSALLEIGRVVGSVNRERQDTVRRRAANDALTVIGAIVESVSPAAGEDFGDLDPDKISEELARLREALEQNDREADDALAAKFDRSEEFEDKTEA